jgi:hypothetical protein
MQGDVFLSIGKAMIFLTAAMLKAGSSWLYNMVNDLAIEAGYQDGRQVRARYHLQSMLSSADCTSKTLRIHRLARISIPILFGNTFSIKSHGKPTFALQRMIDLRLMRAVYIYRDPRDVALSLYEHGDWIRREGVPSSTRFDSLTTIDMTIDVAYYYVQLWEKWVASRRALIIRYEDLIQDPSSTMHKVAAHLGIDVPDQTMATVIHRYSMENRASWKQDLHFNVGRIGRWKDQFSPTQKLHAQELFKDVLPRMGYED